MSIGDIHQNIIVMLEQIASAEEYLSFLYLRLRFMVRDPAVKILAEYLSESSHLHRNTIKNLLDLSIEKLNIPQDKLREVIELVGGGFRDIRDLYHKALETYDTDEIIKIIENLENSVRSLISAYKIMRESQDRDENIRFILEILEEDSDRNIRILKTLCSHLKK
ncbi:MAG: hypothetical protein QXS45_06750 [Sulfolobales archaeon]